MQALNGKILTWILLATAAFGQLLITAGFARELIDRSLPVSYIDVQLNGDTVNYIGFGVIVLVILAGLLGYVRRASATLGAMAVSILLYGTFLRLFLTTAEERLWFYLFLCSLGWLLVSKAGDIWMLVKRPAVPADASELTDSRSRARQ